MDRWWPERITLFAGLLIAGAVLFLGALAGGDLFADERMSAYFGILWVILPKLLLPLWLVLRGFDALFLAGARNRH